MNYIGLDISKISTAMVIETNGKDYIFSYNTLKKKEKWNQSISGIIDSKSYSYDKLEDYSESEMNKLSIFIIIANDLINDILMVINKDEDTIINIEGFSYSSAQGPLIDLVGIASIIRAKLIENIPNIKYIKIVSPKSLKLNVCEMVYGKTENVNKKGVKSVTINNDNEGKSGGNFDKFDMFKALTKYTKNSELKDYCLEKYDEISKLSKIPKPLEDINDAYWLKENSKNI